MYWLFYLFLMILWPRKKRWNQGLEGLRYWQNQDLTIGNLISGSTLKIIILFASQCSNINNSLHSHLVVQQQQQIFTLRNPQFNRYSYIWGYFLELIPILRGSNIGIIVVPASSSMSCSKHSTTHPHPLHIDTPLFNLSVFHMFFSYSK